MGYEKGNDDETGIDNKIVIMLNRISQVVIKKLNSMGISNDELVFYQDRDKPPILNPILHALTLEFLQFEEFRLPDKDDHGLAPERSASESLAVFNSKHELAISKVLSSPWAMLSTIRGREMSSIIMSEIVEDKFGITKNKNLDENECEVYTWSYTIFGGYWSSQEDFDPVNNAMSSFNRHINTCAREFDIRPINNISEREVGWKLILRKEG